MINGASSIQVHRFDLLDSTNLEAQRRWKKLNGSGHPFVIIANQQEAGFGRDGRKWQSPKGGLWMTMVWPTEKSLPHYKALPLVVGLSVSQAIESVCKLETEIKWPNDILLNGHKVAGILCQTQTGTQHPTLFIGIGINGNFKGSELGHELRTPAITLMEANGGIIELQYLLDILIKNLSDNIQAFQLRGFQDFQSPVTKKLAWMNQEINFTDQSGVLSSGVLQGLDDTGSLLVNVDQHVHHIESGEISRISKV